MFKKVPPKGKVLIKGGRLLYYTILYYTILYYTTTILYNYYTLLYFTIQLLYNFREVHDHLLNASLVASEHVLRGSQSEQHIQIVKVTINILKRNNTYIYT